MAWLLREKAPLSRGQKADTPAGLWIKCSNCHEVIFRKEFEDNHYICIKCAYHYPFPALKRIEMLLDENTCKFMDTDLSSVDPLNFIDQKSYALRLKETAKKLNRNHDALIACEGRIFGHEVQLGVFDFAFMGGSMGSVVGEKIARVFLRGAEKKQPAIIVTASGGARMQEGILSLMQMAKTCAALVRLREAGMPFFSVLTDPTTGGVAASFAMLGDINLAEPNALIGFAGPRVIEQTIRQQLPEGFQRSEYLLDHGMLDMICPRLEMKAKLAELIEFILVKNK
ncbi:MAG: acetyl-CoA carboxylase carboxyltransferase subunit beta [Oligoflexales bacterium]|nr:acetyl-CoA carboxylase carboxyltransferase subunit beta [Oligoflexales bacterium]